MENNNAVGIMDSVAFFDRMELVFEIILKKHFTANTVVFADKPIIRPGSSEVSGLMSNKEFCSVFGITRTTLAKWEKDFKTKSLVEPYIVRNGARKAYDACGFVLMAFNHTDKFRNTVIPVYRAKQSEKDSSDQELIFRTWEDRLKYGKLISPKEYISYVQECKKRSKDPLRRGY
jgi:hypothetical protein